MRLTRPFIALAGTFALLAGGLAGAGALSSAAASTAASSSRKVTAIRVRSDTVYSSHAATAVDVPSTSIARGMFRGADATVISREGTAATAFGCQARSR